MPRLFQALVLFLVVAVAGAIPSLASAKVPPLPADVDVHLFATTGTADNPQHQSLVTGALSVGCESSRVTNLAVTAGAGGGYSGGCEYSAEGFPPIPVDIDISGSYSGQINPLTGASTVQVQTTEHHFNSQTLRTRHFTLTVTGTTGETNQFNAMVGTAQFSYTATCTPGTGSDANSICPANSNITITGSVPISLTLYPLTSSDAKVDHIEVVQVVQDSTNTVPLVANKSTVARVFLTSPVSSTIGTITLKGIRNGVPLGGPQPQRLTGGAITIDAFFDRDLETDSVNFLLPKAFTSAGNLDLEVTFTSSGLPDNNPSNNTKTQTVTFQARNLYWVQTTELCVDEGTVLCGYDPEYRKPMVMEAMYPVADGQLYVSRLDIPSLVIDYNLLTPSKRSSALYKIFGTWANAKLFGHDRGNQLAAWVFPPVTNVGGTSDPPFAYGGGRASITQWYGNETMFSWKTLAHETAHNLGARHATVNGCGAVDDDSGWPYPDATVQEPGWDMTTLNVVPSTVPDLMSYCGTQASWMSPHTYIMLFNAIGGPASNLATVSPRTTTQYFLVGGMVKADGTSAELQGGQMVFSEAEFPAASPTGTHCIRFNDTPSLDYCFNIGFEDESGVPLEEDFFLHPIPWNSLVTLNSYRLCTFPCGPSDTIEEVTKSPSVPALSNIHPAFGESVTGPTATVSWTATDFDPGDQAKLRFDVLYSHNGGDTFIPIALGIDETSFSFPTADIVASPEGVFRIVVSDGLNSSEAFSGVVPVGTAHPWGDVGCNDQVDLADVVAMKRWSAGLGTQPTAGCGSVGSLITAYSWGELLWGDVNSDDGVDANDVLWLMSYLAGFNLFGPADIPQLGEPTYTGR